MNKYLKFLILFILAAMLISGAVVSFADGEDGPPAWLPSWYKQGFGPSDVFHNDPSTPRVVDYADIFSDREEAELAAKLAEMKAKFNMDFVVVTDVNDYGLGAHMYAAEFYDMNGYGAGSEYSGAVMFINMEPGDRSWWCAGTGKTEKYFTEKNVNHMDDTMEPYMIDGEYASGVKAYFTDLDTLLTNGKFPMSTGAIIRCALISMAVGLIAGLVSLASAASTMKTVAPAVQASAYLTPDSFKVNNLGDNFINKNVTRTLIESSSSSRSGGSSYSGGYHSSGGHSFSGGGRHF